MLCCCKVTVFVYLFFHFCCFFLRFPFPLMFLYFHCSLHAWVSNRCVPCSVASPQCLGGSALASSSSSSGAAGDKASSGRHSTNTTERQSTGGGACLSQQSAGSPMGLSMCYSHAITDSSNAHNQVVARLIPTPLSMRRYMLPTTACQPTISGGESGGKWRRSFGCTGCTVD